MSQQILPTDVMRFLLTSIPSVPHLEAMLLLRQESDSWWKSVELARRLYISERNAETVLADLLEVGILIRDSSGVPAYRFSPVSEELRQRIDQLGEIYAKHIVEVTNVIHSRSGNKVQKFADAFKFRKDS